MGEQMFLEKLIPYLGAGAGSALTFTIWLVRLEAKVKRAEEELQKCQLGLKELQSKHEALDSQTLRELGRIREALARIEGRLRVNQE